MSIGRDDVVRAARLAEIDVAEADLDRLVAQLSRMLDYVEQLSEVGADDEGTAYQGGPGEVRLRDDVVQRTVLAHPLSEMAPEFVDGFFVVPRRGTMEDDA